MSPFTQSHVMDAIARPARTAMQATPAWIITEFVDAWFYDMNDRQFSVTVLALTMVFSSLHALIEDRVGKGILRRVPAPPAPVIDERGRVSGPLMVALALALLVLVVIFVLA